MVKAKVIMPTGTGDKIIRDATVKIVFKARDGSLTSEQEALSLSMAFNGALQGFCDENDVDPHVSVTLDEKVGKVMEDGKKKIVTLN